MECADLSALSRWPTCRPARARPALNAPREGRASADLTATKSPRKSGDKSPHSTAGRTASLCAPAKRSDDGALAMGQLSRLEPKRCRAALATAVHIYARQLAIFRSSHG